jgi:hypothetical protein
MQHLDGRAEQLPVGVVLREPVERELHVGWSESGNVSETTGKGAGSTPR